MPWVGDAACASQYLRMRGGSTHFSMENRGVLPRCRFALRLLRDRMRGIPEVRFTLRRGEGSFCPLSAIQAFTGG